MQTLLYIVVPVDGNWGAYGAWSTCTATCGGGTRMRVRSCDDPGPSNGGRKCPGSSAEIEDCGTQSCAGKLNKDEEY